MSYRFKAKPFVMNLSNHEQLGLGNQKNGVTRNAGNHDLIADEQAYVIYFGNMQHKLG
jgi:hypothetical protein